MNIRDYEDMMMLDLADDERSELSARLDALEDSFSALGQIDADGTEPLVTVLELSNILRDDVSGQIISREELLENAPASHDGYFRVPGTL